MFTLLFSEGAPWNETHWSHKHFNELLKQESNSIILNGIKCIRICNDLLTMTEGRLFQCLQALSRQHPINLSMKTMPQFGNLMV